MTDDKPITSGDVSRWVRATPVIVLVLGFLAAGIEARLTLAALQARVDAQAQILSRDAFTQFVEWKVNTVRDVEQNTGDIQEVREFLKQRVELVGGSCTLQ